MKFVKCDYTTTSRDETHDLTWEDRKSKNCDKICYSLAQESDDEKHCEHCWGQPPGALCQQDPNEYVPYAICAKEKPVMGQDETKELLYSVARVKRQLGKVYKLMDQIREQTQCIEEELETIVGTFINKETTGE